MIQVLYDNYKNFGLYVIWFVVSQANEYSFPGQSLFCEGKNEEVTCNSEVRAVHKRPVP